MNTLFTQKDLLPSALSAVLVLDAGVSQAATKEWMLDKGHAHIGRDVYHMGLSRISGRFNNFEGEFMLDHED